MTEIGLELIRCTNRSNHNHGVGTWMTPHYLWKSWNYSFSINEMKIRQKVILSPPNLRSPPTIFHNTSAFRSVLSRQLPSLVTVNLLCSQDQSKRKLSSLNNSKPLSMLKALMEAIKIDYLLRAISQSWCILSALKDKWVCSLGWAEYVSLSSLEISG